MKISWALINVPDITLDSETTEENKIISTLFHNISEGLSILGVDNQGYSLRKIQHILGDLEGKSSVEIIK